MADRRQLVEMGVKRHADEVGLDAARVFGLDPLQSSPIERGEISNRLRYLLCHTLKLLSLIRRVHIAGHDAADERRPDAGDGAESVYPFVERLRPGPVPLDIVVQHGQGVEVALAGLLRGVPEQLRESLVGRVPGPVDVELVGQVAVAAWLQRGDGAVPGGDGGLGRAGILELGARSRVQIVDGFQVGRARRARAERDDEKRQDEPGLHDRWTTLSLLASVRTARRAVLAGASDPGATAPGTTSARRSGLHPACRSA